MNSKIVLSMMLFSSILPAQLAKNRDVNHLVKNLSTRVNERDKKREPILGDSPSEKQKEAFLKYWHSTYIITSVYRKGIGDIISFHVNNAEATLQELEQVWKPKFIALANKEKFISLGVYTIAIHAGMAPNHDCLLVDLATGSHEHVKTSM